MTSNQFQIQKEIQAKKVNEILQSVKLNSFPVKAKEKVVELAEHAINSIDAMRKEVYKQTEDFDYTPEKYDHTEDRLQKYVNIVEEGKPIGKLQNILLNSVAELIHQVEKTQIDRITGANFSNVEKSPEYKEHEKLLLALFEGIKEAILLPADVVETPAETEESGTPGAETKTEEQLFEEQLAAEQAAKNNGTGSADVGNTAAGSETKPEETKKNWLGFGK